MGLGAVLPDTLRRNELARVKCVAPSLQIMAPWPSMAGQQREQRRRAIEISILWPRSLVTADTLTGPLALQSQATVTSADTMRPVITIWMGFTFNFILFFGYNKNHQKKVCLNFQVKPFRIRHCIISGSIQWSFMRHYLSNSPKVQQSDRLLPFNSIPQLITCWPDEDKHWMIDI